MTDLSSTAREIIAGRHADPFRYLGPHTENDETVVRVFLPDARRVVAVGARGERELAAHRCRRTVRRPASTTRITGCARNSATTKSSWKTPIASRRPALGLRPLSARRRQSLAPLRTSSAPMPMTLDGVDGVGFVVWAPNAQRVSVVGDFNTLGRPPPRHARARQRLLGNLRAGRARRRQVQVRDRHPRRPIVAAEVRSGRLWLGNAARDRFGRRRWRQAAAPGARARQHQRARPADVDLRGASRLVAAQGQAWRVLADAIANWPSSCRPMPPTWASPMSN